MPIIESSVPTLVKVGVTVVQSVAPKGFELIKSWWKGKTILIVGQDRAGKTTFIDYFQHGLFEDEKDTSKTYEVSPSARFNVKLGKSETLELSVKTAVDVPGQIGAVAHADLVFESNPHAVLIFIDLTRPIRGDSNRASIEWLTDFCKRLETKWRINKHTRNRVKSIIVVLSKRDKVNAKTVESRKKTFQKILGAELKDGRGQMLNEIAIIPCVLVNNSDGTKSVDSLISHLAKALIK